MSLLLLIVTEVGAGTVRFTRALAEPRHVSTAIQPQTDEAPASTLTSGGCDAMYSTAMLSFSGAGKRVVIEDSIARDSPSSKVALTYSHPIDASETKCCEATGTNGPAADALGSHSTPVTTPADRDETATTEAEVLTSTWAKLTSLTYTCAVPSPTAEIIGRAGIDVPTVSTAESVVWKVSSLAISTPPENARILVLW